MRAFAAKNPSFALFALLVPGLLLVEAGAAGAGLTLELALSLVLVRTGRWRLACALAGLACLLLGRAAAAREERLAELAAWRAERAGPLELTGRVEATGSAGRDRTRLLFRVEGSARRGSPAVPRRGWIRVYTESATGGPEGGGGTGGSLGAPPVGARIVARGFYRPGRLAENPGTFDWGSLPGGPRVRGSLALESWSATGEDRSPAIERLRERLSARIGRLFPPLSAGFMQAALLGDRENLDPRLNEVFARTGTGHIIAISGMNVAILAAIGWAALSPFVASHRRRRWLLACALLLYVPLGGSSPSVARAAFMGVALLCAQDVARRVLLPNALGAAGLALLALQPEALLDPSFQLSFAAVLGLALLPALPGARIAARGTRPVAPRSAALEGAAPLPGPLAHSAGQGIRALAAATLDLLVVTATSLVATLPLTLAYFRHLPLLALPANLMVVPALGVLTAGGLAALLSSLAWEPLGGLYASACDLLLLVVFRTLELCARPSWAWMPLPGSRLGLAAGGLCASVLGGLALRAPRLRPAAGIIAALLLLLAFGASVRPQLPRPLEVAFLAVGQGDAIALILPGGEALLVDAGPRSSGNEVVAFLHERRVLRLDRAFATHPDADHVGGLSEVLRQVPADSVHDAGQWGPGEPYRRFLESSLAAGAGYRALVAGERLQYEEVTIDVLWPPAGFAGRDPYWEGFGTNEASLVLLVGYRGLRVLLAGDIGGETERRLALEHADSLASGFLKVSHHGSRFSSVPEFLIEVAPAVALVSAGRDNRYGHPHAETLERLSGGARVWRTDREGALLLTSDGRGYELRGYASGRRMRGLVASVPNPSRGTSGR